MKLIADSGSTKTDWILTDGETIVTRCQTQGINPFHQQQEDIINILHDELLPQLIPTPTDIEFYGSGVRQDLKPVMESLLKEVFPQAITIEAHGDLLGAARALFGHQEGIACILGTGANSGLYDGCQITKNTPPLGYILGDEGSGAVLGIRFLNALYKGFLPESVRQDFEQEMHLSIGDVISRVYRQPLANRFLASLAPFIARHQMVDEVRELVSENFRQFFLRNIVQYQRPDLLVGFVGSIAYYFEEVLRETAVGEGFRIGKILKSPIDGLI